MALKLEIVTPDKIVFQAEVESAVLPTPEGEIGIFSGHVPIVTRLKPGEIRVHRDGSDETLAIDRGFARVYADTVSVIVEAAIDVEAIDLSVVEAAEARARAAIEKAKLEDADPAEYEHFESITRFAIAQRLAKGRKR